MPLTVEQFGRRRSQDRIRLISREGPRVLSHGTIVLAGLSRILGPLGEDIARSIWMTILVFQLFDSFQPGSPLAVIHPPAPDTAHLRFLVQKSI